MLRESAQTFGYELDLTAVRNPERVSGVPSGREILQFVDAALTGSEKLSPAQSALISSLGPEALVDAAAVIGNFEMMNRVADGTGIPVAPAAKKRERDLISLLEIEGFEHH